MGYRRRLLSSGKEGSSAGRKNPKIIEQAASSQASREKGGSGIGGVLFLASGATLGYGAMKLYKDPEFCATARENVPALVKVVEPYIPMADKRLSLVKTNKEKNEVSPTANEAQKPPVSAKQDADKKAADSNTPTEDTEESDNVESATESAAVGEENGGNEESSGNEENSPSEDVTSGQDPADDSSSENAQEEEAVERITAEVIKDIETEAEIEKLEDDAEAKREEVRKARPSEEEIEKIKNEIKSVENEAYTLQQDVRDKAVNDVQANQDLLRKDLEAILAEDLNTADIVTLRRRIVQLVMQVQEQHKNEAAKLVAVLNATETRTSEKIVESLKKQAEKYEELIQAKLTDQEITLREKFAERLDETIDDYTRKIQYVSESLADKYEDEKNAKIADAREEIEAKLTLEFKEKLRLALERSLQLQNERMQEVEEINTRVQMLDKVFHFNKEYLQKSHQIHLVCTALLSLHETLQGGENLISDATASLKVAAGNDPVIESALSSIPKSAFKGIASMTELQSRFTAVKEQCRKSSFEPENAGIIGQALSSVANVIQENIDGDEIFEGNTTEHKLARASYYLAKDDLARSVKEVESMDEKDGAYAADWLKEARTRLLVIQAVRAIGAHVTTLAATLS
eukprot:g4439.t1